jgi:hypothetical protein
MESTKVIFREHKGEVIALFPYEPYNRFDVDSITSYAHIGQHSEADYTHVMKNSKKATEIAYKELLNELYGQGYTDIEVIEKRSLKTAQKHFLQ